MIDAQTLPVLKIQRFSTQDGPGVRTTVFLKGCPLRCKWCHNPESQSAGLAFFYTPSLCIHCGCCAAVCKSGAHSFGADGHILNRDLCTGCGACISVCASKAIEGDFSDVSIAELLRAVEKDLPFYGKDGGLTLSGGEPLLHTEKVLRLLQIAQERGIRTAVETCGYFDGRYVPALVKAVDLFLWDLKDGVEKRHLENTGVSNRKIIENLFAVDRAGGKTVLRCIMLNGVNTDEANLEAIARIYRELKGCVRVEIFSYHHYGESKYRSLGMAYAGERAWCVSPSQLKALRDRLRALGVDKVKIV